MQQGPAPGSVPAVLQSGVGVGIWPLSELSPEESLLTPCCPGGQRGQGPGQKRGEGVWIWKNKNTLVVMMAGNIHWHSRSTSLVLDALISPTPYTGRETKAYGQEMVVPGSNSK